MKRNATLKYLSVLTIPALAYVSFNSIGSWTFLPLIEVFINMFKKIAV